jgi:4'-phosphopantetheinyl transferase
MKDERRDYLDGMIVVWLAQVSTSQERLPFLEPCLDAHDRERAARFRFAEDRARYVLGRALARNILGRYLSLAPERIELAYTDRGRPIFPHDETLHFSLTHTHDLVAVALTAHAQVGIDIEYMERKLNLEELAERILSAEDFRVFKALPDLEKEPAFFRVWTRKEAYLKARGEGISEGLQKISVAFGPDAITFLTDARDELAAPKWRVHALDLPDGYMGSLACSDAAKGIDLQKVRFEGGDVVTFSE